MAYPHLQVRPVRDELGVVAGERISPGSTVLRFQGPSVCRSVVEAAAASGGDDGYLQIGIDSFLGLSGAADDYVNHSCRPNCYVAIRETCVELVAFAWIPAGEEITFDYGTTQVRFPFRFWCLCGTDACRGVIGNADEIPDLQLAEYRRLGAIPFYVTVAGTPESVPGPKRRVKPAAGNTLSRSARKSSTSW